jgi:octaprenyl-diphosphate synthase
LDLIKEIHQFLATEIEQMNKSILQNLAAEEELVTLVGNHIAKSGGKRIRPVLTLLAAKMFDYQGTKANKLATAVEFIHMATLLHDDVVDGSKMRRFLPTANVVWGSKASVLVGDFLFSQSFKLMVDTGSIESMKILSSASTVIAEGEVSQLAKLEEHRIITEDEYLQIINAKTAELFASATQVGAIICDQSTQYALALRDFGRNLGIIFQIIDDLLDYFNDTQATGKNTGEDFMEGKVTLPIILLAPKLPIDKKNKVMSLIAAPNRTADDFSWVKELLAQYGTRDEIFNYLHKLKQKAYEALETIKIENQCKEYLKALVEFAANRSY